jgi:hypothetical protein
MKTHAIEPHEAHGLSISNLKVEPFMLQKRDQTHSPMLNGDMAAQSQMAKLTTS